MHYRTLGRTNLKVSEIGLGCASFWGKKAFDEKTAIRLVHEAVSGGVTFFDTGSSYSGGNAEPRLGRALKEIPSRNDLVIATKAGSRLGRFGKPYKDFRPAWIAQSVEQSLVRLGLDAIPILHLHGPEIEDLDDALIGTLETLRAQGKVKHFSVNSFDPKLIAHVGTLPLFGAVMIDYNILRHEREDLIRSLAEKKLGIFAGMALASRAYSASLFKPRRLADIWYLLRALKNHRDDLWRGRAFRFIEKDAAMTAAQIALAFVLANPDVSCAVLGTTRAKNLREAIAVSGMELGAERMAALRQAQKAFES